MHKNKKMKLDVPTGEQRDTLMREYVGATGGFNWANTSDKIVQAADQKTQRSTTASNSQK